MIRPEDMTPEQRRQYGFVRLVDTDLFMIGVKSNARKNELKLKSKMCEACGLEPIYHRNVLLNLRNSSSKMLRVHLCRECYFNNQSGRSIPKGWWFK